MDFPRLLLWDCKKYWIRIVSTHDFAGTIKIANEIYWNLDFIKSTTIETLTSGQIMSYSNFPSLIKYANYKNTQDFINEGPFQAQATALWTNKNAQKSWKKSGPDNAPKKTRYLIPNIPKKQHTGNGRPHLNPFCFGAVENPTSLKVDPKKMRKTHMENNMGILAPAHWSANSSYHLHGDMGYGARRASMIFHVLNQQPSFLGLIANQWSPPNFASKFGSEKIEVQPSKSQIL